MENFTLNLAVSFCESGTSGFVLHDTTGIGLYKFMPQDAAISNQYYRTCDIAFYDIVTLNAIEDKKHTGFSYLVKSDSGYENYNLKYESETDGWFIVHHLILPTVTWFTSVDRSGFEDGMYYVFEETEKHAWRYDLINGEIISKKMVSTIDIIDNLTNLNLLGVEENIFLIGNLESCFENYIKTFIYNNLFGDCNASKKHSEMYRNRDMVWMALELIHRLIKNCDYYEAQRLLERLQSCNGFCNSNNFTGSASKCNCR